MQARFPDIASNCETRNRSREGNREEGFSPLQKVKSTEQEKYRLQFYMLYE